MENLTKTTAAMTSHTPSVSSPDADLWSCIPFVLLTLLLYLVGREVILGPKKATSEPA
jgi:hypothetical protein